MSELSLGKLESTHTVAPVYVQRAVVVAVASFVCFLAMMAGFYLRQNIGYFLLSTAFLIVYILTMFGLVMLKRNVVKVYTNGISYRKFTARWEEIAAANVLTDAQRKSQAEIVKNDGEKVILSDAIEGFAEIVKRIDNGKLKLDNLESTK